MAEPLQQRNAQQLMKTFRRSCACIVYTVNSPGLATVLVPDADRLIQLTIAIASFPTVFVRLARSSNSSSFAGVGREKSG